ncbi:MAG TPA: serine hydrolase [Burkholderiales bacterium]|nr:serine hydrolase [Burkholderiales bacterium]
MKIKKIICIITLVNNYVYASNCSSIDKYVQQMMLKQKILGMSIAIVKQDKVEYCNYGYTNKNQKNKITEKSIFEIASITKTFTALLAGVAISDNKLDLNLPITRYIPELSSNKIFTKITNKELLSHTSGLPLGFKKDFTESELIISAVNTKITSISGNYYRYSNPGITLSGIAVTRIYNTNYQDLLDKFIFNPLEMKYTSIRVNPEYDYLIVTGYNKYGAPVDFMNIGIENPAGGLKSNTYDLSKYLKLQLNSQNSDLKNALKIVHTNYYCLYEDGTYQQLAWEYHPNSDLFKKFQPDNKNRNITVPHKLPNRCKNKPNGFIDKTGNSSGMTSYIAYLPNQRFGVVILSNSALKPAIVDLGRYILKINQNTP